VRPRAVVVKVRGTFYEPPMAAVVVTAMVPGADPGADFNDNKYDTVGAIPLQVNLVRGQAR